MQLTHIYSTEYIEADFSRISLGELLMQVMGLIAVYGEDAFLVSSYEEDESMSYAIEQHHPIRHETQTTKKN